MRASLLVVLFFFLFLPFTLALSSFVTDNAGIFSEDEQFLIAYDAEGLRSQGIEFAIVTTPSLNGVPIEKYSYDLAEGHLGDEDLDNGLLLVIAVEERQYRFEVGRGLEPILNDAKIGRIGREKLSSAFKDERYGEGVLAAIDAITEETRRSSDAIEERNSSIAWWKIALVILIILLILFALSSAPSGSGGHWDGLGGLGGLGGSFGGSHGKGGFGGGNFGGGGTSGRW